MATREIVELPDKHTGDINEIRDKKIALASEASGATDITAQCEYLIKNGQTGEFMNVLKSYIDESVRSALGALVNNLDKGSSIKSVLATDSSNDLGSITPANLASVLGGCIVKTNGYEQATIDAYIKNCLQDAPYGKGFSFIGGPWKNHPQGVRGLIIKSNYDIIDANTSLVYSGFAIAYDSMDITFFTCTIASDRTLSNYKSKTI